MAKQKQNFRSAASSFISAADKDAPNETLGRDDLPVESDVTDEPAAFYKPEIPTVKKRVEKEKPWRITLNLDGSLKQLAADVAWEDRTSVTKYLNNLIKEDMMKRGKLE